jgi:cytochrome c556
VRECLKKEGITLPTRKPGQRPGAGGFLGGGGGPALPAGVSKAKYEAALKKCGGNFAGRGGFAGGASRFDSPEAKKALAKFAACLRENGVKVGEPNTSGKGAIFNTTGIDTKSAQFTAAETKCRGDLRGAFGARPGAGGAGAPPAGAAG